MRFAARLFCFALLCTGLAFPQDQQPAPPATSTAPAAGQQQPKMGKRGGMRQRMREHQKAAQQLHAKQIPEMAKVEKAIAGRWKTTIKYEAAPEMGMPNGATAEGMAMIHPGPAGNSMMEMFHSKSPMGPFQGVMVLWYSAADKKYHRVWCDSDAPSCDASGTGDWDGDNLVFTSSGEMQGQKYTSREVMSELKPDSFTFELDMGSGDQAPKKFMTINYTRMPEMAKPGAATNPPAATPETPKK